MQCNKTGGINYCMRFPLLSDKPCTSKSKGGSTKNDSFNPDITLVFPTSGNVQSGVSYFVKTKEHQRCFRERTSISNEQCHE